jgi:hypothetical protein
MIMTATRHVALLILVAALAACSGDDGGTAQGGAPTGDHFAKEQQAALEKAKEAEKMIQQAAEQQAQSIEEQTQ